MCSTKLCEFISRIAQGFSSIRYADKVFQDAISFDYLSKVLGTIVEFVARKVFSGIKPHNIICFAGNMSRQPTEDSRGGVRRKQCYASAAHADACTRLPPAPTYTTVFYKSESLLPLYWFSNLTLIL